MSCRDLTMSAPSIIRLDMPSANTEYSIQIEHAKEILFKLRDETVQLRYAFASGEVAAGTGIFMTIPAGASRVFTNLNMQSVTVYFATSSATQFVEIEVVR